MAPEAQEHPLLHGAGLELSASCSGSRAMVASTGARVGPESRRPVGKESATGEQDEDPVATRMRLLALFALILVAPGLVLIVDSVLHRNWCGTEIVACQNRCTDAFNDDVRVFVSDYRPEQECKVYCTLLEQSCQDQANTMLIGGLILIGGLFCSTLLLLVAEPAMKKYNAAISMTGEDQQHATCVEPVYTEEQKRKMAHKPGPWEKWVRKLFKRELREIQVVEARCRDCDMPVEVDSLWLSADRGGMDGARCPRCYRIIIGLV